MNLDIVILEYGHDVSTCLFKKRRAGSGLLGLLNDKTTVSDAYTKWLSA